MATSSVVTNSTNAELYTLDTNILIYAVDGSAGRKHQLAADIVDRSVERPCILTLQALAEFVYAVTRKTMVPRRQAIAQARDRLRVFRIATADTAALDAAYTAVEEGRFGLFDALLLASAGGAGCTFALSEDMHDGAALDDIVVCNPFAGSAVPEDLRSLIGL